MTSLQTWLEQQRQRTNSFLEDYLGDQISWPKHLHRAMSYGLFPGGKRLRPAMVLGAFEAVAPREQTSDRALPAACAVELVHVYTQIHLDLPCMDDEDYHWGRPTCHRVFPQGLALLAGNSLLTLAFQLLSDPTLMREVDPALKLTLIQDLSRAVGFEGALGGESMNLGFEGNLTDVEHLTFLQGRKTGMLFRAACLSGGRLAGGEQTTLRALEDFGEKFGLAFQISGDLLDEIPTDSRSGATWAPNWPALLGENGARLRLEQTTSEAMDALSIFDERAEPLRLLAQRLLTRTR